MAEKDILTGQDKDTLIQSHDADGITEFDNDMPLWWLFGFIFTVVFAFGYLVNYHLAEGLSTKAEYEAEVTEFKKSQEPPDTQQAKVELLALTDTASLDAGRTIFNGQANMCYTCHRNDLGGMVGPNLTDEYWIHGGDFKALITSIKTGFPEKGMQQFGSGAKLSDRQVQQIASFIISMKDSHPDNPKVIDPTREIKWEEKHGEEIEAHEKENKGKHHEKEEKHAKPVKTREKKG